MSLSMYCTSRTSYLCEVGHSFHRRNLASRASSLYLTTTNNSHQRAVAASTACCSACVISDGKTLVTSLKIAQLRTTHARLQSVVEASKLQQAVRKVFKGSEQNDDTVTIHLHPTQSLQDLQRRNESETQTLELEQLLVRRAGIQ